MGTSSFRFNPHAESRFSAMHDLTFKNKFDLFSTSYMTKMSTTLTPPPPALIKRSHLDISTTLAPPPTCTDHCPTLIYLPLLPPDLHWSLPHLDICTTLAPLPALIIVLHWYIYHSCPPDLHWSWFHLDISTTLALPNLHWPLSYLDISAPLPNLHWSINPTLTFLPLLPPSDLHWLSD